MNELSLSANWDSEAQVWIAVSKDVPGLVAEADSFQTLVAKLQILVPELCELNSYLVTTPGGNISIPTDYQGFEEELQIS